MTGATASKSVTFFVPCLNEEGNIGRAIDNIVEAMKDLRLPYEIIVVDDGSTDGSVQEVSHRQQAYKDTDIALMRNPRCLGVGRNYFAAVQRAKHGYYMLVCGDATEPPETIRTIVSQMGQADSIVPYYSTLKRSWKRDNISRVFTFLVNVLGGHRLRYYNGTGMHRTDLVRANPARGYGFGYQAECLVRMLNKGITYKEIDVVSVVRESGTTKAFRPRNFFSVGYSLLNIFLYRFER